MEDKFNQNNFEEFLQEQVRNQRMYPNDAVWREINKKLHGEKRWPALTIAAFLLLSTTVAICIYFTPKTNLFNTTSNLQQINSTTPSAQPENLLNKLTSPAPFAKDKNNVTSVATASNFDNSNNFKTNNISAPVASTDDQIDITAAKKEIRIRKKPHFTTTVFLKPVKQFNTAKIADDKEEKPITNATATLQSQVNEKSTTTIKEKAPTLITQEKQDFNDKNMVDEFLKDHQSDVALHTITKPTIVKHRFGFQIYIAPSFSYRNLTEDGSMQKENSGGPVGLSYVTDVNNVVRHRPGTGIEAGFGIHYNISTKVRMKSGLQFNVRQYSIDAFRSNTEIATIALQGNSRNDTINSLSFYRNNNGYSSTKLVNKYYQIAVPFGLEWEVIGNRKIQFNVAASIQPTYLLNRNAYLLSTNFKNYTENPDMVRKWNLNSNLEAFISYQVGDFKWQVGPQIRYQPYSTFIREYPIREHLVDYGVKVGVSKNF